MCDGEHALEVTEAAPELARGHAEHVLLPDQGNLELAQGGERLLEVV